MRSSRHLNLASPGATGGPNLPRAAGQPEADVPPWAEMGAGEFLSSASHELKSPLTTIKLSLQVAARRLATDAGALAEIAPERAARLEATRETLLRGDRQVARLARLMNDLTDVARISLGELTLRPEPCDLVVLVRDVVEEARRAAPARALRLELPPEPLEPIRVVADTRRIGQVVRHFLANALAYAPPETPIDIRVEIDGARARGSVTDGGPGIPAERQARLWRQIEHPKGSPSQPDLGTGLGIGLVLSRGIVEAHGGAVGLESAPGTGTTFWFTLPRDI